MTNKSSFIPEKLQSLAPTSNADKAEVYEKALKKAIEDPSIFNVALSGPYGSGKSSILKTFAANSPFKCIEISLATFKDTEKKGNRQNKEPEVPDSDISQSDNDIEKKEKDEQLRLIELSIVQQLFYKVDPKAIPRSSFKRIMEIDEAKVRENILAFFFGIVGLLYFLRPSFIQLPPGLIKLISKCQDCLLIPAILCMLIAFVPVLRWLFGLFQLSGLSAKIKISVAEIDIAKEAQVSILNAHTEEIIYMFERAGVDAVMIEDLDRFNDHEIFTKLRELNNLVNSAIRSRGKKKKVTFIYAIKDDIFTDTKRTKFFELIIPVIPVVDTTNAYDVAIKNHEVATKFEDLLRSVTIYIHEKRLLDNIFNEYYLYADALDIQDKQEKLFAIVACKNMYPSDFADLHERKGAIFEAFGVVKDDIAKQKNVELQEQISKLQGKIEQVESVRQRDLDSLRREYVGALSLLIPNVLDVIVNGEPKAISKLELDDMQNLSKRKDAGLRGHKMDSRNHHGYNILENLHTNVTFSDVEDSVNQTSNLEQSIITIEQGATSQANKLKNNMHDYENRINDNTNAKLVELLDGDSSIFSNYESLKDKHLLQFFLREGYIDEMYQAITSRFYSSSITAEEWEFVQNVNFRKLPLVNAKLENFTQLSKWLRDTDFSTESILNYDLIDFILDSEESEPRLGRLMKLLSKKKPDSLAFIQGYWKKGKTQDKFVAALGKYWSSFWYFVQEESQYDDTFKVRILKLLILHATVEDVVRQNEDHLLTRYICSLSGFIALFEAAEVPKMSEVFTKLGVRFEKMNDADADSVGFDFVYRNNMYTINREMISLVLRKKSTAPVTQKEIDESNYTTIIRAGGDELNMYVEENIKEYVSVIFGPDSKNRFESEHAFIALLGKEELDAAAITSIVKLQETTIEHIEEVESYIWPTLFFYGRVNILWSKALSYFIEMQEFDKSLTKYLNRKEVYEGLSKIKPNHEDDQVYQKFISKLVEPNDISPESFDSLIQSITLEITWPVALEEQSLEKVNSLLQHKKLHLNEKNYELLRKHFPNRHIQLLEQSIGFYIENHSLFPTNGNDFELLLESDKIMNADKREIIRFIPIDMISASTKLVPLIFDVLKDMDVVEMQFEKARLIMAKLSNTEDKISFLTKTMDTFSRDNIMDLLKDVGEEYLIITTGTAGAKKLEKTDLNLRLIEQLKQKDIVSKYTPDEKKIKFYLRLK